MRNGIVLVLGVALVVLGGQGAIRILVDHDNAGLLRWMPGGFAVHLSVYVLAVIVGAVLANHGGRQGDRSQNG
ncbi:hypothetical protein FK268_19540 [Tsukamurella sputi]|uniref:Uncharacterized protein n=1 Tax=Tsukamurella sputi TaxID=2591848 RepID=A0A5C5RH68_9ACTN|nr:hypothetical protein [Tsukamurella sputi]TWS22409.1 hypothetical protein FK268_19540 [Tsukamurella sputi]